MNQMAGRKKEPVDLILMKGNKHLTKAEIEERRKQEELANGFTDNISPPDYLSKKQKDEFVQIAEELLRLDLFTNLDVDTLAQYIDTRSQYIEVIKALKKFKPVQNKINEKGETFITTTREYASLQRTKDMLIRQCRSLAGEIGLSINSRLKLVVPKPIEKPPSKFSKFSGDG